MSIRQKEKKQRSAMNSHRSMLALVLVAAVLGISVSIWALGSVQEQMGKNAQAAVQTSLDQLYDHFASINQMLKRVLVEAGTDTTIDKARSDDAFTKIKARGELIRKFRYTSTEAGADYSLFYYFSEEKEFIFAVNSQKIPLTKRPALEEAIAAFAKTDSVTESLSPQWQLLTAGSEHYAVKLYEYDGVFAGSCVPVKVLLEPLTELTHGEKGIPLLIGKDTALITGADALAAEGISEAKALQEERRFFQRGRHWIIAESGSQYLDFRVRLLFQSYGNFESVVIIQAISFVLIAFILSAVIMTMAYTQRRILKPLRSFTEGLKVYDPDNPLLPRLSNEIEELATASEQFHNLTKEIGRLRIDVYEQKLEQQKTKMDYMQLQIKPHFFLNSLNLMYTMAQRGNLSGVSALSQNTTKYLRYLFQSDSERMLLSQELDHIRDFLSIMEIRYPGQFSYEIVSEPEAEAQFLPPLILQTFVENSIKYAMTSGRKLEISISALCETAQGEGGSFDCLSLFVTDNGQGFRPEQIALWQQGGELDREGGVHIGIANVIKRLNLSYKGQAIVQLYNSPMGGAVAELHIPIKEALL